MTIRGFSPPLGMDSFPKYAWLNLKSAAWDFKSAGQKELQIRVAFFLLLGLGCHLGPPSLAVYIFCLASFSLTT
jgi:hypothetical protein